MMETSFDYLLLSVCLPATLVTAVRYRRRQTLGRRRTLYWWVIFTLLSMIHLSELSTEGLLGKFSAAALAPIFSSVCYMATDVQDRKKGLSWFIALYFVTVLAYAGAFGFQWSVLAGIEMSLIWISIRSSTQWSASRRGFFLRRSSFILLASMAILAGAVALAKFIAGGTPRPFLSALIVVLGTMSLWSITAGLVFLALRDLKIPHAPPFDLLMDQFFDGLVPRSKGGHEEGSTSVTIMHGSGFIFVEIVPDSTSYHPGDGPVIDVTPRDKTQESGGPKQIT